MKIFVSNAYLEWIESRRSDKKAIKAFERFFEQVSAAKEIAEAPRAKKRDGGTAQGGNGGTVLSYEIARTYRLYGNWRPSGNPVEMVFYAAVALSKSNEKSQSDDIGSAIDMFKSFNMADWVLWTPSPELVDTPSEPKLVATVAAADEIIPAPKSKKAKGKPVDKNGMTAAERKSQRRKEEVERQRLAAEQKRADAAKKKETAKNIVPDNIDGGKTPVATPASAPAPNKSQDPVMSTVTLNGAPIVAPQQITGDVDFQNVASVQYELDIIDRKIKIERLQIEIIRQNIALAQRSIALEELEIKKLELLQMKSNQEMHR